MAKKKKLGRPFIALDETTLEKLAAIGCTTHEIAAFMNCSPDTIERNYAAVLKKGKENGKSSLRRMQWKAAESGNTTMQIWLGKQLLDQTDKREIKTIEEVVDRLTKEEKKQHLLNALQELEK